MPEGLPSLVRTQQLSENFALEFGVAAPET